MGRVLATGQFHLFVAMKKYSSEVIPMSAVTATPYAPASPLELRKMSTRAMHPIIISQFTSGMYICPSAWARGMHDGEPGAVAELDGLANHGESPGNHCLRGYDGRKGREGDHGIEQVFGNKPVERIDRQFWLFEKQCALPEIVEEQGRVHEGKPGNADGPPPEMPHVRIQGFTSGNAEDHRSQNDNPVQLIVCEESEGIDGDSLRRGFEGSRRCAAGPVR